MADVPDHLLPASQLAASGAARADLPITRPLSRSSLILLTSGSVASLLFTITYLIEGATRPDYNALQQAVSALSLGPGGWVQQINFVFFGLVTIAMAFVWREILKGGAGATWYPILRCLEGLGLIADGFFSQDPTSGYPREAILTPPTLHGTIHTLFAFVCITSMAIGYFVLARRFAQEPRWGRGWAVYSVISGLLTMLLIAVFGTLTAQHSQIAGLFERLATSGVSIPFGLIVLIRVWLGVGFTSLGRGRP
ncbi:MAG TPA: DUF998 domain-containing protein [Ktedonobacteraceae bacterium]|nr:DUF998 domain-containing protein [Ktedonobacteraceae bacterium]